MKKIKETFPSGYSAVILLIVVNSIVFLFERLSPPSFFNTFSFSLRSITERHQFWRILTANFLHANFQHLFSNMIYLACFGIIVLRNIPKKEFLRTYFLSGFLVLLIGTIEWKIKDMQAENICGASCCISGILGAEAVMAYKKRKEKKKEFMLVCIMLGVMLTGDLGTGAAGMHMAGVIIGMALTILQHNIRTTKKAQKK